MSSREERRRPVGDRTASESVSDDTTTVPPDGDTDARFDQLLERMVEQLSQIRVRAAARNVVEMCGGIICADHLTRIVITDPAELWWSIDCDEPCWECHQDMAEDDQPLAVYRSGGYAVACHLDCFDEDDPQEGLMFYAADPWNADRWGGDYPDQRWCDGCDREFTVMQPIPGPKRRYCTESCYLRREVRRRPRVTHSCLHCGVEFVARADALTCSARCRQAASRGITGTTGLTTAAVAS